MSALGYRKPAPEERDPRNARFMAVDHMDGAGIPLTPAPKVWQVWKSILDQGQTGRCTEFGLAANRGASPNRIAPPDDAGLTALYRESTYLDPWPENDGDPTLQSGTSVHAAVQTWRIHKMVGQYLWITDQATMDRWLDHVGPVVVGTDWFHSMFTPVDKLGTLKVDPASGLAGGHCYCILGRSSTRGYRMVNSWGIGWGWRGRGWIKATDFWGNLNESPEIIGLVDA